MANQKARQVEGDPGEVALGDDVVERVRQQFEDNAEVLSEDEVIETVERLIEDYGKVVVDQDYDDEPQFPIRLVCESGDEDPIDLEISHDCLNVILDKSNNDGVSFNDAFCAILQEGLDLMKDELEDEQEEQRSTGSDAFDAFEL